MKRNETVSFWDPWHLFSVEFSQGIKNAVLEEISVLILIVKLRKTCEREPYNKIFDYKLSDRFFFSLVHSASPFQYFNLFM